MRTEITKQIGAGYEGQIYLGKLDDTECVVKLTKYDGDTTLASSIMRQIKFNEDVASKHKDRFMFLAITTIVENCNHKIEIPKDAFKEEKLRISILNNLPKCAILYYYPVLEGTMYDISLNKTQFTSAMRQVIGSIDIMRQAGYMHRDIHRNNIMFRMVGGKLKWYLIDYGGVYHAKFPKTDRDKKQYWPADVLMLVWEMSFMKGVKLPPDMALYSTWPAISKNLRADKRVAELNIDKYLPPIKDAEILWNCKMMIIALLRYDWYFEACGGTGEKYAEVRKELRHIHMCPELFLMCIKHCMDKDYSKILSVHKK